MLHALRSMLTLFTQGVGESSRSVNFFCLALMAASLYMSKSPTFQAQYPECATYALSGLKNGIQNGIRFDASRKE